MMRSTLPYKNPDVFERIVLEHKVPLPRSLDSKLKRAIIGITGAVYPETGGGDEDGSDVDDDMPALEQASVASGDENDWQEHGESNIEDELAPGKLEPRAFNRPGQSRPAPGLRRDPITEQVKQHAEQIARKEAKVRAAKRRQSDADVRARADRPEELFQHEREERDRLRVEKGFVVDEEDAENPKIYTCCLKQLQTSLEGMPKVNVATLTCKYDEEEYGIRANSHRLRMDCEKGCELRCHHPSCVRALTVCGLHSKDQPWGKMDAKNTSQQLSRDGVVMHCLNAGCGGRLIRTAIEKDRGVRRAEVWYHAKWHQAIIEEEERQKKVQEEEAARARAEADELRRKEEKAAEIEAKKAAKQAAKVAKEAARRPDLVGLDGVQVPVPPKKPAKAKAQAEMEAAKAEVPKPDISEVERMIEQEGGGGAPKPRDTDDVFAAVPNVKADKKNKRKDRRDKKKKVLDVEFGERPEEEAEAAEAGGVDAIVERAVQRMPPPEAQPEAAAAAPRLVEEFPDLAVGSAQASGEAAALAMLEARNFREANDSIPVTPFLLCKNLDIATLLDPEGLPLRTADRDSSIWKRFGKHLDRYNLRKVEVFEAQTCAALEVGYYDGASACMALNGQPLGNKPVIASHLIEFPDVELMTAILNAQAAGEDPDQVIRNFVAKRREARAQPSLPTFQAKRTAQAAPKATAQPLQVQHPPSKGSASAMPSAVNAFPPPFQPSGKAVATKTALAPPPAPVVSSAPPPAPAVPTPPDRTFEDAEKWLRSSLNPQAGLQAIPQVWIGVTDLYVLAPLADNLEEHYLSKARFLLDFKVFPEYKEIVDEGRQATAALVLYDSEKKKFYGVMRLEPRSQRGKVSCSAFIEAQPGLREAATKPAISAEMEEKISKSRKTASHYVSTHAWQILDAFSVNYGLRA